MFKRNKRTVIFLQRPQGGFLPPGPRSPPPGNGRGYYRAWSITAKINTDLQKNLEYFYGDSVETIINAKNVF